MKILMINQFHYNKGGVETYFFQLIRLLQSKGQEVIPFSMQHEKNIPSSYSKYFPTKIDYIDSLKNFGIASGAKVVARSIYSIEARKKIELLLRNTKPDIAHLHAIHNHLTPSILYVLRKYGVPVVWTLHDYKLLLCPNNNFFNDQSGEACRKCRKFKYYQAALTRCKKNSLTASLVASIEAYLYLILRVHRWVDKFISPSRFLMNQLIDYGFKKESLTYLPNFMSGSNGSSSSESSDYFAYIGRLAPQKGVETLIQAVSNMRGVNLQIIGDGPMQGRLQDLLSSSNGNNISFLGYRSPEEINSIIKKAMFLVHPSKHYENCPYSILEAFAWGKPVVASRIGGIPELVEDNSTGLLFRPGDATDLRNKIHYLLSNRQLVAEMGKQARKKIEEKHNSNDHYERLLETYEEILK